MEKNEKEISLTSEIIIDDFYDDEKRIYKESRSRRKINSSVTRKIYSTKSKQRLKGGILDYSDIITIDYFTIEDPNSNQNQKERSVTSQQQICKRERERNNNRVKIDSFYDDEYKLRKTNTSEKERAFLKKLYNKLETKRKFDEEKTKEFKISIAIRIKDDINREEKIFKIGNEIDKIKSIARNIIHFSINDMTVVTEEREKKIIRKKFNKQEVKQIKMKINKFSNKIKDSIDESKEIYREFSPHCEDSLGKSNILKQPLLQIKRDSFSRSIEEDSLAKAIYKRIESVESSIDENESDESVELDKEFSYDYCEDSLDKSNILVEIKRDSFSRPLNNMENDSLGTDEIEQEFTHLSKNNIYHSEDSIEKSNFLNNQPQVHFKRDSFSIRMEEDSLTKAIDLQADIYKRIEPIESSIDENESEESMEIDNEYSHLDKNKSYYRDSSEESEKHSLAKTINLQGEIYKHVEIMESSEDDENESEEIDKYSDDIDISHHCEDSKEKSKIRIQPLVCVKSDSFSRPSTEMEEDSLTKAINLQAEIYKQKESMKSSIDKENESDKSVDVDKEFSHLTRNKSFSRDSSQEKSEKHNVDNCEDSLTKAINLQTEIYKQILSLESSFDENESDEIEKEFSHLTQENEKHNVDDCEDSLDKSNILNNQPLVQIKIKTEEESLTKAINLQTDNYKQIKTMESSLDEIECEEIKKECSYRDSSQESDKNIDDYCENSLAKATNLQTDIYKRLESNESSIDENESDEDDKHNDIHCEDSLEESNIKQHIVFVEDSLLNVFIFMQAEIYKQMELTLDKNESDESVEIDKEFSHLAKNNSFSRDSSQDFLDNSNNLIEPLVYFKRDSFSRLSTEMEEDSLSKDISLQTVIYKQMELSIDENESDQDDNHFEDSLEKSNFLITKRDSFSKTLTQIGEDSLANLPADIHNPIETLESSSDENESDEIEKEFSHHYEDSLVKSNILIEPLVYIKRDSFSTPIGEDSIAKSIKSQTTDIYNQIESIKSSLDENESDQIKQSLDQIKEDSISRPLTGEDSLAKAIKLQDEIINPIDSMKSSIIENEADEIDIQRDDSQDSFSKSMEEDTLAKSINLKADIYNAIGTMESSLDKNESDQDDKHNYIHFEDSLDKSNILKLPIVCIKKDLFSTLIEEEDSLAKDINLQSDIYKRIESVESSLDENESEEIDDILKQPLVLIKRDSFSEQMEEDSLSKAQAEIYNPINSMESSIDENESNEDDKINDNHFEDSLEESNILQIKRDSFSKTLTQIEEDSLSKTINLQIDFYKQIETNESSIDENESDKIDKQNDNVEFSHRFEDFFDHSNILVQTKRDSFCRPLTKFGEDSLSKAIYEKIDTIVTSLDKKESDEKERKISHLFEDSLSKSNTLKQPSDQLKRDSFSKPVEEDSLGKSINLQNKIYKQLDSFSRPFTKMREDSLAKTINLKVKKEDLKYFFI